MPKTLNSAAVAKPTQLPIHQPSALPIVAPTNASKRDTALSDRPPVRGNGSWHSWFPT